MLCFLFRSSVLPFFRSHRASSPKLVDVETYLIGSRWTRPEILGSHQFPIYASSTVSGSLHEYAMIKFDMVIWYMVLILGRNYRSRSSSLTHLIRIRKRRATPSSPKCGPDSGQKFFQPPSNAHPAIPEQGLNLSLLCSDRQASQSCYRSLVSHLILGKPSTV